jgi:hypothetical protein
VAALFLLILKGFFLLQISEGAQAPSPAGGSFFDFGNFGDFGNCIAGEGACGPRSFQKKKGDAACASPLGISFGGCLQVEQLRSSGAKSGLLHLLTRSVCC